MTPAVGHLAARIELAPDALGFSVAPFLVEQLETPVHCILHMGDHHLGGREVASSGG